MSSGIVTSKFTLRLRKSTLKRASEIASNEGISLNQFITLAVAEKTVRMQLEEPKRKRRTLSPEARARIAEGQRKRWAKKRTKQS